MICFEIEVNGKKICTAGVGESGVLSLGLTWVGNHTQSSAGSERVKKVLLNVGGLTIPENDAGEFVNWMNKELRVGDEVKLSVIESTKPDEPAEREPSEKEPSCSFCGKVESEVSKIIAAQQVSICNECIEVCSEAIANNEKIIFERSVD